MSQKPLFLLSVRKYDRDRIVVSLIKINRLIGLREGCQGRQNLRYHSRRTPIKSLKTRGLKNSVLVRVMGCQSRFSAVKTWVSEVSSGGCWSVLCRRSQPWRMTTKRGEASRSSLATPTHPENAIFHGSRWQWFIIEDWIFYSIPSPSLSHSPTLSSVRTLCFLPLYTVSKLVNDELFSFL